MTTATPSAPAVCENCGTPLERKAQGGLRKRYCTPACRLEAWIKRKGAELNQRPQT